MPRDKQTYKDAAIRLKARREAKGITIPELADKLGVGTARYRSWEKIFGPLPQRQYGDAIDRILRDWETLSRCQDNEDSKPPNELDYKKHGIRAQSRREFLGLSRSLVAGRMGVSEVALLKWERSLPRNYRGGIEDAWEDALQVPRGWIRAPFTDASDLPGRASRLSDVGCLTVEDEIRAVGAWLTRARAMARTWDFEGLSEAEQKRAIMFADRYGVSGEGGTILQAIGDKFGLTRERARQVIEVMTNRSRGVQLDLPRLAQIKEATSSHPLWLVSEFEAVHRDLLGRVSLPDADRFAREILGFSVVSISERAFGQNVNSLPPMIIDPSFQEILIAVRAAAMKMIRSCGAAHVMYVTGLASEIMGKAVALSNVRKSLVVIKGMEWLTEDQDWFWLGPDTASNRVLEAVKKVLATASRKVDVEDLHQAVCRSRRAYYKSDVRAQPPEIEVPQEVLREILARVPWLSVIQMNDFVLTEDIAAEDVLNSSELAVVRVIEEHGGAAARQVFNKRFVDTGMFSVPNLQIVLTSSPVIRQLGYGIYGVRGKEFPQKAFALAFTSVTKCAAPVNLTDDGWCEFTFSISEAGLRNGIADIPRGVLKMITPGIYMAEGVVRGTFSVGNIQSAPTRTSGLVGMLREADIQPGERLLFSIHPESMRAMISRTERLEPE
jgi:transcriptional regulator with XRE-family HTH domain